MSRNERPNRCNCEGIEQHALDGYHARIGAFFRACRDPRDLRCCLKCLKWIEDWTGECTQAADAAKLHPEQPFNAALVLLDGLTQVSVTRARCALETAMLRCKRPHGKFDEDTDWQNVYEAFVDALCDFVHDGIVFGSQPLSSHPITRQRKHWPITLDELFPLGADRGIDALVYWCCAASTPSLFTVVYLCTRVARNVILPRLLAPENRARLAWAMIRALSEQTPASWPGGTPPFQFPQGFREQGVGRGMGLPIPGLISVIATSGNAGDTSLTTLVAGYEAEFLAAVEQVDADMPFVDEADWETLRSFAEFLRVRLGRSSATLPSTERLMYQFATRTTAADQGVCANATCRVQQFSAAGRKKMYHCGRCRLVRYCSSECQRSDWSASTQPHKVVCATLARLFYCLEQDKLTPDIFHSAWTKADLAPIDVENLREWILASGVVPEDTL